MKSGKWAVLLPVSVCLALVTSCKDEEGVVPSLPTCCHPGLTGGSHTAHVDDMSQGCTVCHDGYDSLPTHNDGQGDTTGVVSFGPGNPAGAYDEGTSSCSSLYCHGPSTVVWGGAPPSCGDCHDAAPTSGSHRVHIRNDFSDPAAPEYDYACGECHSGAGDGTALHANFAVDVVLDPSAASLATGYGSNAGNAPTWVPGTKACGNVYCHSNGVTKETGGAYDSADIGVLAASPYAGVLSYNTPVWDTPATVSCGACHAAAPLGAIVDENDYPPSGQHRDPTGFHVVSDVVGYTSVQCFWCHATSSLEALQGTYGSAEHVNGALEFHPCSTDVPPGTVWSTSVRSYGDGHCGNGSPCWY